MITETKIIPFKFDISEGVTTLFGEDFERRVNKVGQFVADQFTPEWQACADDDIFTTVLDMECGGETKRLVVQLDDAKCNVTIRLWDEVSDEVKVSLTRQ